MNFGGGNMQQLMKQAQAMQRQLEQKQAELEATDFTAVSGGGMVSVTLTGAKVVKELKINKDVVDADDVEMLEDLVIAAFNEAISKVDAATSAIAPKMPF